MLPLVLLFEFSLIVARVLGDREEQGNQLEPAEPPVEPTG